MNRISQVAQPVAIGIYRLDVSQIDDAGQTIRADFMLWLRWQDTRLADDRAGRRRIDLNEVWNPRVQVVNERSLERKLPDSVEVDANGRVLYVQRMSGTISSATDLADFPFDEQALEIRTIAGGLAPEEVDLVIEPGRTGRSARLSIVDWEVGPLTAENYSFEYAADGRVFPGGVFAFAAKRHAGFYLWKVIFPLVVVVLMSWTVFWIDPSEAAAQLGVAATSILALIAYQFVLGNLVPRLSYLDARGSLPRRIDDPRCSCSCGGARDQHPCRPGQVAAGEEIRPLVASRLPGGLPRRASCRLPAGTTGGTVEPHEAMIEITDLCFRYPEGEFALHVPELLVAGQERVAVIGASGSGKATLLNLMAGIRTPQAGMGPKRSRR